MNTYLQTILTIALLIAAWLFTFGLPENIALEFSKKESEVPQKTGGPRVIQVETSNVEVSPFVEAFRSIGTAKAMAQVSVSSDITGHVVQVHFGANHKVKAGDALVSLESELEQIALRTAKASMIDAKSTLQRYLSLQSNQSGSVTEATMTNAKTQLELAQANLAKAKYDLAQRTIRAPISGTLGLTDVEPGYYLAIGSHIVTITDQSRLIVEFGLSDRAAGLLDVGQSVQLETSSALGKEFDGTIEGFDGSIDATTRTIKVRAGMDNSHGSLLPGMIFTVTLAYSADPLPKIPAKAITWSREGASVWLVENGKVSSKPLVIRHRQNSMVWIDADIKEGEQIVVEGVQKLWKDADVVSINHSTSRIAQNSETPSRLQKPTQEQN